MKPFSVSWTCLFAIVLCIASTAVLEAQDSDRFVRTHYSVENYLENNTVIQVAQDGHGLIWLHHSNALARFDGNEFRYYHHNYNDSLLHLGPDNIGPLIVDEDGNLWVNNLDHAGGSKYIGRQLSRYDLSIDGFISYKPNLTSFIRSLSVEKKDTLIWLGSRSEGLFLYNLITNELCHYVNQRGEKEDFENTNCIRSILNRRDHLLLGTQDGIWRFNKNSKEFVRDDKVPEIFNKGIIDFNNNRILNWNQEGKGVQLSEIDSTTLKVRHTFNFPSWNVDIHGDQILLFTFSKEGLLINPNGSIDTLMTNASLLYCKFDKQGNIWFATEDDGVYKFSKSRLATQRINLKVSIDERFYPVDFAGHKQTIFLGTNNYIATSTWPPGTSDRKVYTLKGSSDRNANLNYPYQGKNNFWVASWFRGVLKIPIDHALQSLSIDKASFLEPVPGNPYTISSPNPWTLYEDDDENLWVGYFDRGIDILKHGVPYGSEGAVVSLRHDERNSNSLSSDMIQRIMPRHDGSILIGTGDGVDKYENGIITRLLKTGYRTLLTSTEDGDIYATTINSIPTEFYVLKKDEPGSNFTRIEVGNVTLGGGPLKDQRGRLWIATPKGLLVLDPTTKEHILLRNRSFDLAQISETEFIAVNDPAVSFNPNEVETDSAKVDIFLSSIKINNKKVTRTLPGILEENISTAKVLTLDHRHNNFELEFSAIDFKSSEQNVYKYKLEGYDNDWVNTDARNRTATYTNLNPGTYNFKVKASNQDGVWSDKERTLKVIILSPPWRTSWAYTGYAFILVGLLFLGRRMIVQRERLKGSLKLAKVEQEKEHFELEKAKEVDRIKTSFFTNISHEFRTPLTLIQGPVQDLLDKYSSEPKTKEKLKLVQRNSDLLLKLINQLLDLAKLDAGNLKIEKSKGEVMRFVKATGSSFSSLAAQKDLSIDIDVPAEPCIALFDRDKLETILINLINNAIKFTPTHGRVNVNANVDNNSLLIQVKDTGIGIPLDQLEKIFERFHQVSESHKEVGTGIGLALVKELVSLLGGTISVKSEIGKGSAFTVTLPLEIVNASDEEHIETLIPNVLKDQPTIHVFQNKIAIDGTNHHDETDLRPRVLVVEDNADLRSFIIESLGEEFHFLEAENGRQGFNIATSEIPDLIVSDIMMPEMDGITMVEKIKTDVRSSHIPLILLTAKSTETSKLSGLESGADDYLTKPFNKHELLLKVRNGITRQRKLREKVMAELMSEAPRKEVLSADEQFLMKVKEDILNQLSNEQLSVESLAEQIGISRVHLYRKISGLTGMSVNELIRKLRLHRAAQLLQQHWGPVSQVAYEVGYSNLSYFSKVFKEEFGVLPSDYTIGKVKSQRPT